MKRKLKQVWAMLATVLILSTFLPSTIAVDFRADYSEFNISTQTEDGAPISGAAVYLYSFDEDKIVCSDLTDEAGIARLLYEPENSEEMLDDEEYNYLDYLVYVQKSGYTPAPLSLSKGM